MKCPDVEKLIAFAVSPAQAENEEIASHVFVCPECREVVAEVNGALLHDAEPSELESAEIRDFIRRNISKPRNALWDKLAARIAELFPVRGTGFSPYPAPMRPIRSFAATRGGAGAAPAADDSIAIVFAACCDNSAADYWEAELKIPAAANDFSLLPITVTDRSKHALSGGKLNFLGKTLFVFNGRARISFADFRKSLGNAYISYTGADGGEVIGDLMIC